VNYAGELHAVAPANTPAHRATVATMDSMRLMGEVCQYAPRYKGSSPPGHEIERRSIEDVAESSIAITNSFL
jgi:hypothetical protein